MNGIMHGNSQANLDALSKRERAWNRQRFFQKFTPELGAETVEHNVTALNLTQTNKSESPNGYKTIESKGGLTISAAMEELSKDKETMGLFREFVKYEQLLVNFAWKTHQLQHEAALVSFIYYLDMIWKLLASSCSCSRKFLCRFT